MKLAIVGLGKIARDEHLPALAANRDFELVATVDPAGAAVGDTPAYRSLRELRDASIAVDAVSLCTPPQVRSELALESLAYGWHVFLEKPPAATLLQVDIIRKAAEAANLTLFGSWHARHAAGVEPARRWLGDRVIQWVEMTWREDARRWHAGQSWLWEAGGLGVFDPGINALSIVTHILPRPLTVEAADLDVPSNRQAPIAARLRLRDSAGVPLVADFDFRQQGPQTWEILIGTNAGDIRLSAGGAALAMPGDQAGSIQADLGSEYRSLYKRFAELIGTRRSDLDDAPLRLVEEAFRCARRHPVAPYIE